MGLAMSTLYQLNCRSLITSDSASCCWMTGMGDPLNVSYVEPTREMAPPGAGGGLASISAPEHWSQQLTSHSVFCPNELVLTN